MFGFSQSARSATVSAPAFATGGEIGSATSIMEGSGTSMTSRERQLVEHAFSKVEEANREAREREEQAQRAREERARARPLKF